MSAASNGHLGGNETLLLGWVEGTLAPEEQRRVAAMLASDADLRHRAELMRADRRMFASLGDERAPADLLASVADAIEREMLLGPQPEMHAGPIPIATTAARSRAKGPSWLSPLMSDRGGRRLALAAGILLMLGVGAWVGTATWLAGRFGPEPGQPELLADRRDGPRAGAAPIEIHEPLVVAAAVPDEPEAPSIEVALADGVEPPTALALIEAPAPITAERALELLREGRLVIRVRAVNAEGAVTRLARIADRSGRVRLVEDVPESLASALRSRSASPVRNGEPMVIASDGRNGGPEARTSEGSWTVGGIVLIEMDATARTLSAAMSSLSTRVGHHAIFEAMEASAPMAAPAPESVLWWRQEPERWVPRAMVPVVIEVPQ